MNIDKWTYSQMESFYNLLQQSIDGWWLRTQRGEEGADQQYERLKEQEREFYQELRDLEDAGNRDAKAFLARHWDETL